MYYCAGTFETGKKRGGQLGFTGERGYNSVAPKEQTNIEMSTLACFQQNLNKQTAER